MDAVILAAARALAAGDPLAALRRIALRSDPAGLALRGIAMAQLGDLDRARHLLRSAATAFGPREIIARARCRVAEVEVALVARDLGGSLQSLRTARTALELKGDRANSAHAACLEARYLLLIGKLEESEQVLGGLAADELSPASRVGYWLVTSGLNMRRIRARHARSALEHARHAAREAGIPALIAEVEQAEGELHAPAARLTMHATQRLLSLDEVEALVDPHILVIDACQKLVRAGAQTVRITRRPVLFELACMLGEAYPEEASRDQMITRLFRVRRGDGSHRARLRVQIGRLRKVVRPLAALSATKRGFLLKPHHAQTVAVLTPPVQEEYARVMSLLADSAAWSSSGLALALGQSPRTVQRALDALANAGKVEPLGHGRSRRWMAKVVPGFPTALLLPGTLLQG